MLDEALPNLRKFIIELYMIYAASALLQFYPETLVLGFFILIVAFYMTRSKIKPAEGTVYASHIRWQIRTFWIGTGVIVPAATIVAAVLVWYLTDIKQVMMPMLEGNMDDIGAIMGYLQNDMGKMTFLTMVATIPATYWWLHRCWVGYLAAKNNEEIKNIKTWM